MVPGFKEILDALENMAADPLDFTAKANVESWVANDISAGGFGAVIPSTSGDWVTVGSIAGIESEVVGEWAVGIVRRVQRLDDGQQRIGMQVLSRNALGVRVMREDASPVNMRLTQRMPLDDAILLTQDASAQMDVEALVKDEGRYDEGNVHMLAGRSVLLLQIQEVVEKYASCVRVRFTVLGVET